MTKKKEVPAWAAKAAVAGIAVGSAAIAAALLYAGRRKQLGSKAPPALSPPKPEKTD
jgi:hypothetical protein